MRADRTTMYIRLYFVDYWMTRYISSTGVGTRLPKVANCKPINLLCRLADPRPSATIKFRGSLPYQAQGHGFAMEPIFSYDFPRLR